MARLIAYPSHPDKPDRSILPANHRVYATGDIHGRLDCLLDLQAKIAADQRRHPVDGVTEIYLGDYTDRGPQSCDVLQNLIDRRIHHNAICLTGNHDLELKNLLNDPFRQTRFQEFGGAATMRSYGVSDETGTMPMPSLYAAFAEAVPQTHKDFLASISAKPIHRIGDAVFVHAGIRPNVDFEEQELQDLIWIREEFSGNQSWHGALITHGHTITPQPLVLPNRICVDTGAYRSGCLTCVVLEAGGYRFIEGNGPRDLNFY
eukprot:gene16709-16888_t